MLLNRGLSEQGVRYPDKADPTLWIPRGIEGGNVLRGIARLVRGLVIQSISTGGGLAVPSVTPVAREAGKFPKVVNRSLCWCLASRACIVAKRSSRLPRGDSRRSARSG